MSASDPGWSGVVVLWMWGCVGVWRERWWGWGGAALGCGWSWRVLGALATRHGPREPRFWLLREAELLAVRMGRLAEEMLAMELELDVSMEFGSILRVIMLNPGSDVTTLADPSPTFSLLRRVPESGEYIGSLMTPSCNEEVEPPAT